MQSAGGATLVGRVCACLARCGNPLRGAGRVHGHSPRVLAGPSWPQWQLQWRPPGFLGVSGPWAGLTRPPAEVSPP